MPTVRQADSLWIDYSLPNFRAIDSTWSNWLGEFEISTTDTSTPAVTGDLTRSDTEGIFHLRLNTTNTTWTSVAVGTYKLMVEFTNPIAEYREERSDKLIVKNQGLT